MKNYKISFFDEEGEEVSTSFELPNEIDLRQFSRWLSIDIDPNGDELNINYINEKIAEEIGANLREAKMMLSSLGV